jgi:hypothetical protein
MTLAMKIDLNSMDLEDRLRPAAEYICVKLHPPQLRSMYVEHLRVHYRAEAIVYVLQALSTGMTALFLGLLTNYLYDKYNKSTKDKERENRKLEKLIAEQERQISELEALLKQEKDRGFARRARQSLSFHNETLIRIKNPDSSIELLVRESVELLEAKGTEEVSKEVDSHWDDD